MKVLLSSPCPRTWERMPGGTRARYCSACRLNVYNLNEMSREEIAALFRKGRVCGRLYFRGDRTATLRDCPQGSGRRNLRRALALVGVLVLGALGWLLRINGDRDRSVHPQWVRDVIEFVDPMPSRGEAVIGLINISPAPPSTPPIRTTP